MTIINNFINMSNIKEQPGQILAKGQQYEPSIAESNIKSLYYQGFQFVVNKFKEYQPRSGCIKIMEIHQSPHVKLKKYKQAAYYGDIVNTKRHGQGIMLYNNNRLYEGAWQCDYKHGEGFQQFSNGCIYQGGYVNGRPEGQGRYSWVNGQFYEGQWLNGLKHGSGMWQGAKGDSYVGEWKFGKADGFGVHVWVNADRYEGEFKQCLKHGEGTEKFANGDLYKGAYAKGKPNGFGQYFWANGSYYKGVFKEGLRHGQGIWKKGPGNSDKYEGEYCKDKKEGYGIFTWSTGNTYKGSYSQDLRHGYGQMFWSDGSYYKGQWSKGIQNGEGNSMINEGMMYVFGEGVKTGQFRDNVLVEADSTDLEDVSLKDRGGFVRSGKGDKRSVSSTDSKREVKYSVGDHRRRNFSIKEERKELRANPLPPSRADDFKGYSGKYKFTLDMGRKPLTSAHSKSSKKQRIPHSAFYMHKIHKRVSTAQNQYSSIKKNTIQPKELSVGIESNKNEEAVKELRKYTRKNINIHRQNKTNKV